MKTIREQTQERIYPVPGYSDTENMWDRLMNVENDKPPRLNRYANSRSPITIQVEDKMFRMRKNPAYVGELNLPMKTDMSAAMPQ